MCWKGSTRLSTWWDLEHIENHSKLSMWWESAQRWSHTDNSFWARNVVRAGWNVYQLDAIKMVAHFRRYQMIASIATSDSELLSFLWYFHKQDQQTSYKWFHTPNQSPVRNHQKSNVPQKFSNCGLLTTNCIHTIPCHILRDSVKNQTHELQLGIIGKTAPPWYCPHDGLRRNQTQVETLKVKVSFTIVQSKLREFALQSNLIVQV